MNAVAPVATPSPPPARRPDKFKVLSLAGGGFLGLYTACVLEALEARAGKPLGRCFDLIAGTSVGGILALALAFEVPMSRLIRLFDEHGTATFSSRGLPAGPMSRLIDLTRSVLGPKYSGEALRAVLAAELGDRTLAQALHPLVIPAVEVNRCCTKIFKTPHVPASAGDETLLAVDVAMATSAAPAYFPAQRIGERLARPTCAGSSAASWPGDVALHCAIVQCAISTGRPGSRVIDLVVPPSSHSRVRLWP
ncbi:patatin-like phospholipase family protein [Rhizobacter sp. J219]|uniref:patatin-like phospholipase family protein n=1 Tax=Rhizobacter sp. J219 TaxID=2898430 RepID=UPI002150DAFA|nr:patatin-like phospholipase family protein [Rhizobacter sp. J219]MCR5886036.1 patatin-like phospholipase family protein [Rhizobacter sp. J219]